MVIPGLPQESHQDRLHPLYIAFHLNYIVHGPVTVIYLPKLKIRHNLRLAQYYAA